MGTTALDTVAVLMTDLVGSTAMADRVGPVAAEELRQEHFELLRGALQGTAGREVKSLGDGLMAVFASTSEALACAVAIQQAIEARNRRAEEPLGVRVGVSFGEATFDGADYFGAPVAEAARLCAHAQGGQIIVNDLVQRLGGSRHGHRFRSLGGLELRGFSEPVRAFELEWDPAPAIGIRLPSQLREPPATQYVGRVSERDRLTELWDQARQGSRRLALIGGEAGVGKTRLSTHLALRVHSEGSTVLYGRCDEDLGVPYQPWVHALRHLVNEAPKPVLDAHVERFGGALERLTPALRERVPELAAPRDSDQETERYLLYDAVVGLLEQAAAQEPLLLILDDLHWAGGPTMSLLRHVAVSAPPMAVMVVGTYRDSELLHDHPLSALLADLHREQSVERIKLTGLNFEDVAALMEVAAGHEVDEAGRALAEQITRETAGNPFFVGEVLRHLVESGTIAQEEDGRWRVTGNLADLGLPQSVREVIGRRVERLGPDARTALSAAAVIGRDFDLELLLAVVDLSEGRLLDLLDAGVAASLLQETGRADRFAFTHALVEYTLYEDLGHARRARLHKRVAEALEQQCGADPGERLGELAGHWAAAVATVDPAKAIHYARRAGERALEQLAPDEAARWYRRALELQDSSRDGDRFERCELLIGLGEAQRQVGNPEHRQTLLDAAGLAQELGDTGRLCNAVIANSRGYTSQLGAVDSERVQALEAAADALPHDDPRRARVLALLASELHFAGDPARCRALAADAIEIARAGHDPASLAFTLHNAIYAIQVPDTLQQRRRLAGELAELSQRLDHPPLSVLGAQRPWDVGLEAGDRSQVESALITMRTLAAAVPEPTFAWQRMIYESVWALIQGDLEAAERWAIQAFEAGTASGQRDALTIFGGQLFRVRYQQARTGELAEQLVQFAGEPGSLAGWRAFAAIALVEADRADEARAMALAEDFQRVPWDFLWSLLFVWADACVRLDLTDRAAELYALLEPFPGQFAGAGLVFGSIDWALGKLATILGRFEQAERHFAGAAELDERFGAPLLLARTRAGWARALIAGGQPEDSGRAQDLLEQADATATRLGAAGIVREVAECRLSLAPGGSGR